MTTILVTGAAGFLGFHLARKLAERPDTQVICVDNFVRGVADSHYRSLLSKSNVRGYEIDLCDGAAVSSLPTDVDVIYHMAALNGTQNFYERPLDVVRCCLLPTLNLVQTFGPLRRVKRFVHAGTSESYAATVTAFDWPVPTAEDVPLGVGDVFNPRWSYGGSKIVSEIVVCQGGRSFDMPFSILRYHNAYGPRMGDKHVIPDFLERAKNGVFSLYGHADTRSFIYVDDCIAATMAVATSPDCAGEIINVGGEQEITIKDLAVRMMAVCGLKGDLVLHPSPEGSVKRRAPDVAKLRRLTDFQPTVALDDGLSRTADYYLHGRMS